MKKEQKPRIIVNLLRDENKISEIIIKDIVKKVGDSGYVALPSELIGDYVQIKIEVLKC